jgi:hypothetical protein
MWGDFPRLPLNQRSKGKELRRKRSYRNASCLQEARDAFKTFIFTNFCVSDDLSHFAAFFIETGTKTSIAENVLMLLFIVIVVSPLKKCNFT